MSLSRYELATFEDSVSRALAGDVELGPLGGYRGATSEVWSALAELGAFAVLGTEEQGGLALGWEVMQSVLYAFGAGLSTQPFMATAILGAGVLRHAGRASDPELLLGALDGSHRLALAYGEEGSRYNPDPVGARATKTATGFGLSGRKTLVLGAEQAGHFLVTARTPIDTGEVRNAIFCVSANLKGVTVEAYHLIDGRSAGTVTFDDVELAASSLVAVADEADRIMIQVLEEAALATAIEAVGAMKRLFEDTIDYCSTRSAFGSPVSKFQAVQHKLVDMRVALEYAVAVVENAVSHMDGDGGDRARAVSVAKAVVGAESDFLGGTAIQLHGAIGTTEDLDAGRYFKRMLVCRQLFGDVDYHRRHYMMLRPAMEVGAAA